MFTTEAPAPPSASTVTVTFCDGTNHTAVYEASRTGLALGLAFHRELAESGEDTSILNQAPHVVELSYEFDGKKTESFYTCRCRASAARTGAQGSRVSA